MAPSIDRYKSGSSFGIWGIPKHMFCIFYAVLSFGPFTHLLYTDNLRVLNSINRTIELKSIIINLEHESCRNAISHHNGRHLHIVDQISGFWKGERGRERLHVLIKQLPNGTSALSVSHSTHHHWASSRNKGDILEFSALNRIHVYY